MVDVAAAILGFVLYKKVIEHLVKKYREHQEILRRQRTEQEDSGKRVLWTTDGAERQTAECEAALPESADAEPDELIELEEASPALPPVNAQELRRAVVYSEIFDRPRSAQYMAWYKKY